jgi:hypothetical protein
MAPALRVLMLQAAPPPQELASSQGQLVLPAHQRVLAPALHVVLQVAAPQAWVLLPEAGALPRVRELVLALASRQAWLALQPMPQAELPLRRKGNQLGHKRGPSSR